jgi:hypothetical protein
MCDHETSKNEEAKARYRAVKTQPRGAVTPGKQTKKETMFCIWPDDGSLSRNMLANF